MENATMCAYPRSDNALPHWKWVLRYYADCPCINIPDQQKNMSHIYHIIGCCTDHGRITLKDNKICCMCKQEYLLDKSTKIYTRKELVMTETTIYDFHTSFSITVIQTLDFHLLHVCKLGKNHLWWNATHSLQMTWIIPRFSMLSWLCWEGSCKIC